MRGRAKHTAVSLFVLKILYTLLGYALFVRTWNIVNVKSMELMCTSWDNVYERELDFQWKLKTCYKK